MVLAFQMLKTAALYQSYIFEGHKMDYMNLETCFGLLLSLLKVFWHIQEIHF